MSVNAPKCLPSRVSLPNLLWLLPVLVAALLWPKLPLLSLGLATFRLKDTESDLSFEEGSERNETWNLSRCRWNMVETWWTSKTGRKLVRGVLYLFLLLLFQHTIPFLKWSLNLSHILYFLPHFDPSTRNILKGKVWWCFRESQLCSWLIILLQFRRMTDARMRYVKDLCCEQEHDSHQSSLISSHRSSGSLAVCFFLPVSSFKTTWLKCAHTYGQRSQTSIYQNDKSASVLLCLIFSVKHLCRKLMLHNICILLWFCTFFCFVFLIKQNH